MRTSAPGPDAPEGRPRAIEWVRTRGLPRAQGARDLGITVETRRVWVRQAESAAGRRAGVTSDDQAAWPRRRRESAVLTEERAILKQAARVSASERAPR